MPKSGWVYSSWTSSPLNMKALQPSAVLEPHTLQHSITSSCFILMCLLTARELLQHGITNGGTVCHGDEASYCSHLKMQQTVCPLQGMCV